MRAPPTAASLQPPGGGGFYPTIYEVPRDEDDPLAGYSEYLAWGNVFNAVLIILCAIYGLIVKFESSQSVEDFSFAFVCAYMIFFGFMLLGFEYLNSSWMQSYESSMRNLFGFMYDYRTRFGFTFFVATLCFSLNKFGIATGVITLLNGVLNSAILHKYPHYQVPGRDTLDEHQRFMAAASTTQYGSNQPHGEHSTIINRGAMRADI